ncbi:MAG: FAD-binding oxidoreductase [Desulfobacterota bacterium]|nr:FAD-binding oxidoreductase [Thermodesulfobacteriota bacterium]
MEAHQKKKVVPNRLPREVFQALIDVVGAAWVSEDRAIIETYSRFSVDAAQTLRQHQKDPTMLPACVVLPGSTEEVQAIMRIANRYRVPVVPFTNGQIGFCGPTNDQPTMTVHLSRMNRVLEIDEKSMVARLEPFADYAQLQAEAMKRGLWNGGSPLATTLCKPASQTAFAGIWQTDLKYGTLSRNIVSTTVVLPTGEVLQTGSDAVAGVRPFWEYGPGPDLLSMIRGSAGSSGIITEITVKLHPWPGGIQLPEPPAGRPCIHNYHEPRFDTASPPANVKLLWVEFPDYDTQIKALQKIAQSGIGMGLNATGVYNAYYCSQTQEMTLDRVKNRFFPPYNCYIILCGFTSPKQIAYEEKVFRKIIDEVGGTFLSPSYKEEVLEALQPWNLDCIRHVTGFRMNRHFYGSSIVPGGPLKDTAYKTKEIWTRTIETYGETYITDRGGVEDTPFLYAINRGGRFWLSEADTYPDATDPEKLQKAQVMAISAVADFVSQKFVPIGMGVLVEPLTSAFPETGPNANRLMRKFRTVLDPNNIFAPGRQVYTKEEFNNLPEETFQFINFLRTKYGLHSLSREK